MTTDSRVCGRQPAGTGISAKGWCDGAPPAAQAAQRRAATIRKARTRELYRLIRSEGDLTSREPSLRSALPERAGEAGADVGPGRLRVGGGGWARGGDLADPVVDLVLTPVAHGGRHAPEDALGGILDGGRPGPLHLRPPRAEVEQPIGRRRHGGAQARGGRRIDLAVDQRDSLRVASAL